MYYPKRLLGVAGIACYLFVASNSFAQSYPIGSSTQNTPSFAKGKGNESSISTDGTWFGNLVVNLDTCSQGLLGAYVRSQFLIFPRVNIQSGETEHLGYDLNTRKEFGSGKVDGSSISFSVSSNTKGCLSKYTYKLQNVAEGKAKAIVSQETSCGGKTACRIDARGLVSLAR